MQINLRAFYRGMSEQVLDFLDVRASVQESARIRVAKGMTRDLHAFYPRQLRQPLRGLLNRPMSDVPARLPVHQPAVVLFADPGSEQLQELRWDGDDAVPGLALLDFHFGAGQVDVLDPQVAGFAHAGSAVEADVQVEPVAESQETVPAPAGGTHEIIGDFEDGREFFVPKIVGDAEFLAGEFHVGAQNVVRRFEGEEFERGHGSLQFAFERTEAFESAPVSGRALSTLPHGLRFGKLGSAWVGKSSSRQTGNQTNHREAFAGEQHAAIAEQRTGSPRAGCGKRGTYKATHSLRPGRAACCDGTGWGSFEKCYLGRNGERLSFGSEASLQAGNGFGELRFAVPYYTFGNSALR